MPKKPQGQAQRPARPIVDQQNDPFLKGLNNRTRNINKKLAQITQLEQKGNLKQEQLEKVKRKEALLEERSRIQETVTAFKTALSENAEYYRNVQLRQLNNLGRALAVLLTSGMSFSQHDRLADLWNSFQNHPEGITLNGAIQANNTRLRQFANDVKLQATIQKFVEKKGAQVAVGDGETERASGQAVQKIVGDVEQIINQKETVVVPQVVKVSAPVQVAVVREEPVVEKKEEIREVVAEVRTEATQEVAAAGEVTDKGRNRDRGNRDNRGRDGDYRNKRGDGKYRENRGGDRQDRGGDRGRYENRGQRNYDNPTQERRQYRPKYEKAERTQQPRQVQAQVQSDSSASPQPRQFRKEQIRQLENDGFIVVGKPKPKAKDQRDQQRNYDNTHGRKGRNEGRQGNN